MAIGIIQRVADNLVVLPGVIGGVDRTVPVGEERIVAGSVQAPRRVRGADGAVQLVPGGNVHQVGLPVGPEQAHAVGRARVAGGIGDVHPPLMGDERRSLVDPEAMALPGVGRRGQQHLRGLQRQRVGHLGDVEVGDLAAHAHLLRPHAVAPLIVLKDCHVQREIGKAEFVAVGPLQHAALHPGAHHRVVALAAQHPGPQRPYIVLAAGGEIDVPPSVQKVQLRGPDVLAHIAALMGAPDDGLRRVPQALQRIRGPKRDAVIFRHGGGEIPLPALVQHIRVGPLGNEGRVPGSVDVIGVIHGRTPCE